MENKDIKGALELAVPQPNSRWPPRTVLYCRCQEELLWKPANPVKGRSHAQAQRGCIPRQDLRGLQNPSQAV